MNGNTVPLTSTEQARLSSQVLSRSHVRSSHGSFSAIDKQSRRERVGFGLRKDFVRNTIKRFYVTAFNPPSPRFDLGSLHRGLPNAFIQRSGCDTIPCEEPAQYTYKSVARSIVRIVAERTAKPVGTCGDFESDA